MPSREGPVLQYSFVELKLRRLLKIIRAERDLILSLTSLGLTPKQAFELISDTMIGQAMTEDDPGEGLVDASDRLEGREVITWWNDIEKDKRFVSLYGMTSELSSFTRYKQWPVHIQGVRVPQVPRSPLIIRQYLRPIYPGQFHTIRRNTWNVVLVLDLALAPSLESIADAVSTMIQRGVPIKFGVVPMWTAGEDDMCRYPDYLPKRIAYVK